jgi:hypothetical protein
MFLSSLNITENQYHHLQAETNHTYTNIFGGDNEGKALCIDLGMKQMPQ